MPQSLQFQVAVCDDDKADREEIAGLVQAFYKSKNIDCAIKKYENGKVLLKAIESGGKFHLLILDVIMDDLDGIGLAALLRKQKNDTVIVFVSSNKEMALLGYEVSAIRYLIKPLHVDKLHEALAFCYQIVQDNQEIAMPTTQGFRRIAPQEILYIEAGERGTKVFLSNEQVDTTLRIFEQEDILPRKQFLLCHRAFLVNLASVRYIRRNELELTDGTVIPVSKYRFSYVKEKFMEYLKM